MLTPYQEDQIRRLREFCEAFPKYTGPRGMAVSLDSSDVPPVWVELAEIGVVKVDTSSGVVYVKAV